MTVQGIGHVVSFKNGKMHTPRGPITKPRYREWMQKCADSFALQLLSKYRTLDAATRTALSRPSWIASCVPLDDSVREIVDERIVVMKVPKGQEGAEIEIEAL